MLMFLFYGLIAVFQQRTPFPQNFQESSCYERKVQLYFDLSGCPVNECGECMPKENPFKFSSFPYRLCCNCELPDNFLHSCSRIPAGDVDAHYIRKVGIAD